MAERVGVRELRQNLSKWLRRVESGESFEVTERGTPVALLTQLPGDRNSAMARLEAEGRVMRRGHGSFADLEIPDPKEGMPSASEVLDELRRDVV